MRWNNVSAPQSWLPTADEQKLQNLSARPECAHLVGHPPHEGLWFSNLANLVSSSMPSGAILPRFHTWSSHAGMLMYACEFFCASSSVMIAITATTGSHHRGKRATSRHLQASAGWPPGPDVPPTPTPCRFPECSASHPFTSTWKGPRGITVRTGI